jgi:hypothetical protein
MILMHFTFNGSTDGTNYNTTKHQLLFFSNHDEADSSTA